MIAFAEHRPPSVDGTTWTEYVRLMTAAGYGKVTPSGVARLNEIYDQVPEILAVGRDIDFGPRCTV